VTRWWWVRHGPTHQKNLVGWRDVPADLSDLDRIDRLARYLPADAVLVSSDLIRARDTALELGRGAPQQFPDLREIDFGDWDGLHYTQIEARDPELSRAYWENPGDLAAPNGESWNAAAVRVAACVDRINQLHPDRDIIAVAHFGAILTQVQRALGCSGYAALGHSIDNLSVTEIHLSPDGWRVERINHSP